MKESDLITRMLQRRNRRSKSGDITCTCLNLCRFFPLAALYIYKSAVLV